MAASKLRASAIPLAVSHPEIAAQLVDQSLAWVLSAGSNRKEELVCSFGHVYSAAVKSRTRGYGCSVCSSRSILIGFSDLATVDPELASQLVHPERGTQVTRSSRSKELWRCALGHEWRARVASRSSGSGCSVCAGKSILIGFNDLATVNPELANQLVYPERGTQVTRGLISQELWRCAQGHEWIASVRDRSKGRGCSVCAGKSILIGFSDLATVSPELASQLVHPERGTQVTQGSNSKELWRCAQGHEWVSSVNGRSSGQGCPVCAGQSILIGFNDLATVSPELASQLVHPERGTQVTQGSNSKELWRCALGHEWLATVGSRSKESGCPACAPGSHAEDHTHDILSEFCQAANIDFRYNTRPVLRSGCRPLQLDFCLPDIRLAIEIHGRQHRRPASFGSKSYTPEKGQRQLVKQQLHDEQRRQWCSANGILLVEIDYGPDVKVTAEQVAEIALRAVKDRIAELGISLAA
jgi:Probable Zinc-ribbon domain